MNDKVKPRQICINDSKYLTTTKNVYIYKEANSRNLSKLNLVTNFNLDRIHFKTDNVYNFVFNKIKK